MSSTMTPPMPTWAGFIQFLQNVVGIPTFALPQLSNNVIDSSGNQVIDSTSIDVTSLPAMDPTSTAFYVALCIVNDLLQCTSPLLYTLAVYNLATDRLINFAVDQPDQSFWADKRTSFNINSISIGVVASAADQGTSAGLLNPETMRNFTMFDLQTLKTPWGRAYMGIAQSVGPTLWGLS